MCRWNNFVSIPHFHRPIEVPLSEDVEGFRCRAEQQTNARTTNLEIMADMMFDYQFRLILIGDSTVGKSSLLKYFNDGKFVEVNAYSYSFRSHLLNGTQFIRQHCFSCFARCPIQQWALIFLQEQYKFPTGRELSYSCGTQLAKSGFGESRLPPVLFSLFHILCSWLSCNLLFFTIRSITKSYYRNSVGALLIYDVTKRASFEHIPIWMNDAKRHIEPHRPVFVLVGCKLDLVSKNFLNKKKKNINWR